MQRSLSSKHADITSSRPSSHYLRPHVFIYNSDVFDMKDETWVPSFEGTLMRKYVNFCDGLAA